MEAKYSPQETAQLVLDQIRMHPETHDQRFWTPLHATVAECGTVMCVGGWVIYVNGVSLEQFDYYGTARELLGLSDNDAHNLFYTIDDASAVHALEYLAKGVQIDWETVKEARRQRYEN